MCDHPSGVGARVPVDSLPCGYLANLCPVWLPDGSLSRCISGVVAKTRGKVTFFFCIISPFREVFVPLLANCALIYLLHNSLKSKNIANFAPTNALVAELVDAPDLGSGGLRRVGSSPIRRTLANVKWLIISYLTFLFYPKSPSNSPYLKWLDVIIRKNIKNQIRMHKSKKTNI